jgi:hypothetical protein
MHSLVYGVGVALTIALIIMVAARVATGRQVPGSSALVDSVWVLLFAALLYHYRDRPAGSRDQQS